MPENLADTTAGETWPQAQSYLESDAIEHCQEFLAGRAIQIDAFSVDLTSAELMPEQRQGVTLSMRSQRSSDGTSLSSTSGVTFMSGLLSWLFRNQDTDEDESMTSFPTQSCSSLMSMGTSLSRLGSGETFMPRSGRQVRSANDVGNSLDHHPSRTSKRAASQDRAGPSDRPLLPREILVQPTGRPPRAPVSGENRARVQVQEQHRASAVGFARNAPHDRFSPTADDRIFISNDDIRDDDVLCGRDTRGESQPGNAHYRGVIAQNRAAYRAFRSEERQRKTDMSTRILDNETTGRFLVRHDDRQYKLKTRDEARVKISQALRD